MESTVVHSRSDVEPFPHLEYSVLLVNFNMGALTGCVIENVATQLRGRRFEIIVADNSTDPGARLSSYLNQLPDNVRLLNLTDNRGFVDALNRIIPLARGRWMVIMHPDVEFKSGCLGSLVEFLKQHPRAAVASPNLFYPDGQPNKIRLRLPTIPSECRRFANKLSYILLRRQFLRDEVLWNRTNDCTSDMVMSVCMIWRGEALRQIAPIDSRFVFYYANDYLCSRALKLGWTCHYVLGAYAIHCERHAPREMYSAKSVMDYKTSTIAANPRMRADYLIFLTLCYPLASRSVLRLVALFEDGLQLLAHLRQGSRRKAEIGMLWESIRIDLGLRRAWNRNVGRLVKTQVE